MTVSRLAGGELGTPAFQDSFNALVDRVNLQGTVHYVDTNVTTGGDGTSWGTAFKTMAAAFAALASGDTIVFRGKVLEQLETPAQVFDVTVRGMGNRPRHADSTPDGGQEAACSWTEPVAEEAGEPLVRVMQQGWRFENILFYSGDDNASIELYRDAGAGDAERDASHASIVGCRFASGYRAIHDTGGCYNVLVEDCTFVSMTDACILGAGNIGAGQGLWVIRNNRFTEFVNGVKIQALSCLITGNTFTDGETPTTTYVLSTLNGGTGTNNMVVENFFQTLSANFNSPDIVGNATDVWRNYSIDGSDLSAAAAGLEVGTPA
jgi:hypothetical protein